MRKCLVQEKSYGIISSYKLELNEEYCDSYYMNQENQMKNINFFQILIWDDIVHSFPLKKMFNGFCICISPSYPSGVTEFFSEMEL